MSSGEEYCAQREKWLLRGRRASTCQRYYLGDRGLITNGLREFDGAKSGINRSDGITLSAEYPVEIDKTPCEPRVVLVGARDRLFFAEDQVCRSRIGFFAREVGQRDTSPVNGV